MINNPTALPDDWYCAHETWAHAHEAAEAAEQKAKVIEAELFNQIKAGSAEARKMLVRERDEYKAAVWEAIQRRTAANLALGKRQQIEKRIDIWRTLESTKRAEMTLR